MKYDVISADCHVDLIWLPPDLFIERLDRGLLEEVVAGLLHHGGLRDEWRAPAPA